MDANNSNLLSPENRNKSTLRGGMLISVIFLLVRNSNLRYVLLQVLSRFDPTGYHKTHVRVGFSMFVFHHMKESHSFIRYYSHKMAFSVS